MPAVPEPEVKDVELGAEDVMEIEELFGPDGPEPVGKEDDKKEDEKVEEKKDVDETDKKDDDIKKDNDKKDEGAGATAGANAADVTGNGEGKYQ